jgi:type I restriction enzyme S subunit
MNSRPRTNAETSVRASRDAPLPEVPAALSAPWPTVHLGDIAEVKLGKMLDKAKHVTGQRLPYLRNINVRWGSIDTSDLREMSFDDPELDRFGLKPQDVLVCEGGEPGRAAVWNGHLPDLKYQKAIHRVRFKQPYEPHLLVYLLELLNQTGGLERRFTGSTIKHFTREAFVQLPVPVPPLPEQRRIVAEIEKQFTRLAAGVAALKRVQTGLKRYRAAVLKAACEGKLIPTEANAWKDATLRDAILGIEAGKSFRCDERPPTPAEIGVVKVSAVTWGTYNELESKTCQDHDRVVERYLVSPGDFLFSRANTIELIGACVIAQKVTLPVMLSDKILRFRFSSGVDPKWVLYWLRSEFGRSEIERLATGNQESMRNIGQERIRQITIRLPPLEEQTRIVAEVEQRMSVVEEVEAMVSANVHRATRLRQSILQQAFAGNFSRR